MAMAALSPSFSAQDGESVPATVSDVAYSPSNFSRTPASNGSTLVRNSSGGKPSSFAFHSHLCPMAQMLRFAFLGSVMPLSVAATMSQCSNADAQSSRFSGLWRDQSRSLENPHSEQYTPPHHSMASSFSLCAAAVI